MARIKNGILGGIQGNIGNVEGYIRNGVACVRARKRKSKKKRTPAQLRQQQRMKLVNSMLSTMTEFIRLGFTPFTKKSNLTANNAAKSYQLLNAVGGEYPEQHMDYSAVLLAHGKMDLPLAPVCTLVANGIEVSWQLDAAANYQNRMAQAMILVYSAELKKSFYTLSGARRTRGSDFLELPTKVIGKEIQVYLAFTSEDRTKVSNSSYLGAFVYQ